MSKLKKFKITDIGMIILVGIVAAGLIFFVIGFPELGWITNR